MAFMPIVGYTAGLGKLNVNSGLGEPLKADVELLSVTPEELSTLSAAIASEEAYNVQGIARLGIHNNIKVELAKSDTGSPILKIRSSLPISDPYLDMLIQVDWASGRLLREYTVLLDPPEYKSAVDTASDFVNVNKPLQATGTSSVSNTRRTPANTTKSSVKKSAPSKTEEAASADASLDELKTKQGDTLVAIAQKMQTEGVSLDQMLVGLFENNKSAFANGNMNQLKVGQIIKAPSAETLSAIDPKQAKQTLKLHSSNWNAYRNSLAGNVKTASASEDAEPKQSASGKIASAEDKSAVVKPGVQDVVKLSAGDKNTVANQKSATAEADAKITAMQEEATARENALKESLSRVAALEKQIEDMQKLLALKNQTMTELQKNAEVVSQPVIEKTKSGEKTVGKSSAPAPAVKPEVKKPAVVNVVPPVPAEEPSFVDSLLSTLDLQLLGGTSALVFLGAGWLFLRNKRRKDLDSFERGILTSGGLRANTVFGNTTGNSSTTDTSFLTDFAQSADGSMIDTNDVDPIAEAEVYMAYGRDAQAEEILKDAIVKEPKRYELHLKLLEMYAGRKDISAFEAVAGELYTTLGANDPTWSKVAELGKAMEPENPLYDLSSVATSAPIASAVQNNSVSTEELLSQDVGLDFSLDDEPSDDLSKYDEITASINEADSLEIADNRETSLNIAEAPVELESSSSETESYISLDSADQGLAFELGAPEETSAAEFDNADGSLSDNVEMLEDEPAPLVADNSLDFSLTADADNQPVAPALNVAEPDVVADNSISFEVPSFLDTAPNIEFSSTAQETDENEVAEFADVSDNPVIEFSDPDSEPVSFEIPDTPMEISFDLPSEKIEIANLPNSLSLDDNTITDSSNDQPADDGVKFDFSLDDFDAETTSAKDETPSDVATNEFDFSAISLDLSDDDTQATITEASDATDSETVSDALENPDVDIKLDLVAAYIDMDDKEGARELLEEVLKEGGPQQKQKAEQLLAAL